MTTGQIAPIQTSPPAIELMGALCSLLIHDFANHLCVISGNAHCAQMFVEDPKRVSPALSSVLQASEVAANLLAKCGEMRRGLGSGFPPGDLSLLAEATGDFASHCPGWIVRVPAPLAGRIPLPHYWVTFAASELAKASGAAGGTVWLALRETAAKLPGSLGPAAGPSTRTFLEVRLTYRSDQPFPFDEIRSKHTNLTLLAACELVKLTGGRTVCHSPSPADQEIILSVPAARVDP